MTLPAPDPRMLLAAVEPAVYRGGWFAHCPCGMENIHCLNPNHAREVALDLARGCPMARRRATRWRRQQQGLVA